MITLQLIPNMSAIILVLAEPEAGPEGPMSEVSAGLHHDAVWRGDVQVGQLRGARDHWGPLGVAEARHSMRRVAVNHVYHHLRDLLVVRRGKPEARVLEDVEDVVSVTHSCNHNRLLKVFRASWNGCYRN